MSNDHPYCCTWPPHPAMIRADSQALAVLAAATTSARAVLARRAALDACGKKDRPLFVLVGELHDQPEHHLFEILLTRALRMAEPQTVCGLEVQHDYRAEFFRRSAAIKSPLTEYMTAEEESAFDPDGQKTLNLMLGVNFSAAANYSSASLYHFLFRENIPVALTDCAKITLPDTRLLDMNDPSTQESSEICYPGRTYPAGKELSASQPDAVNIRNHHIVKHSIRFAEQHKSRLMVLFVGSAHIAGNPYSKFPEKESLAAYCMEESAPLYALPLNARLQEDVARARCLAKEDSFFPAMPEGFHARYERQQYTRPLSTLPSEHMLLCEQDERTYFDRMATVAGLGHPGIAGAPYSTQQTRHHDRICDDFNEWINVTNDTVKKRKQDATKERPSLAGPSAS